MKLGHPLRWVNLKQHSHEFDYQLISNYSIQFSLSSIAFTKSICLVFLIWLDFLQYCYGRFDSKHLDNSKYPKSNWVLLLLSKVLFAHESSCEGFFVQRHYFCVWCRHLIRGKISKICLTYIHSYLSLRVAMNELRLRIYKQLKNDLPEGGTSVFNKICGVTIFISIFFAVIVT